MPQKPTTRNKLTLLMKRQAMPDTGSRGVFLERLGTQIGPPRMGDGT